MEDPTGRFGPKPEPPLQLELEKRAPSKPSMSASNASSQRDFYPESEGERQRRQQQTTRRMTMVLVLGLVVAGGVFMAKNHFDAERARELATKAAKEAKEEAELLKELAVPKNAPDCWVGNGGFVFIYEKNGTSVIVESIQDVPVKRRRKAQCVPQ